MPDYIFKTYIDSGREYYEYTDALQGKNLFSYSARAASSAVLRRAASLSS